MELTKEYKKYRWFFTSSGKLVIGGKSATQNDDLLKNLKRQEDDFVIMHTVTPGSPFSIILSPIKDVNESDLEETAIFTGCFSRAWRSGKKREQIHIFKLSQIYKNSKMKTGTWGVNAPIEKKSVSLELALTRQKKILRAVPISVPNKKDILIKIKPGKLEKSHAMPKIQVELSEQLSQEELLSALPAGGIAISRDEK